jgi:MFS family permease
MTAAEAPDWRRNQAAVTTAAFVGFASFTLVMPFLPLYFELLGVTDPRAVAVWSGVSFGVTPAVTAAMAPVWARVADRYGRKLMVARSLASFVVIMALLAFVTAPWQVLLLRAIQGLFAGYGPIAMTMAAESAPADETASAIGWVQTAQRLGPALGPLVGGVVAEAVGLRRAFLVSSAVYLLAFVLVVAGYRESPRAAERVAAGRTPIRWRDLVAVPHFFLFMTAVFTLQLVDRSFGPILPLYLREAEVAPGRVVFWSGLLFTLTAGAAAVGNQLSGRLLRRRDARDLVPAMAAVSAASALVFALAAPVAVLAVTAVAFGFGMGVATTTIYTAASAAVPVRARGAAFGYLTSAYLVGLAVSPVVAGLIGAWSMRAVFVADLVGLGAVAWSVRRQMARQAPGA